MTTKDPLEDMRERKQDLLAQIQAADGDPEKQAELEAQKRELRKEKAAHVASLQPGAEG